MGAGWNLINEVLKLFLHFIRSSIRLLGIDNYNFIFSFIYERQDITLTNSFPPDNHSRWCCVRLKPGTGSSVWDHYLEPSLMHLRVYNQEPELSIEPRYSDMRHRHLNWCLNCSRLIVFPNTLINYYYILKIYFFIGEADASSDGSLPN